MQAKAVRLQNYWYYPGPLSSHVAPINPLALKEATEAFLAVGLMATSTLIVCPEALGVPVATALSIATGIPFSILRKKQVGAESKSFTVTNRYRTTEFFLGTDVTSARVVLVDDVVSSGSTVLRAVAALRGAGATISGIGCLVVRGNGHQVPALAGVENFVGLVSLNVHPDSGEILCQ